MTREALHELIERIPEEEIAAAQGFLEHLAGGAAFRATSQHREPVLRTLLRV